MHLEGVVYDFGDGTIAAHLRAIAGELATQSCVNGEQDPSMGDEQPLRDLATLLGALATRIEGIASGLA